MGIPLFYEPTPARSEPNVKSAPSASSRSSIRRQRSIRHPHRNGSGSGTPRHRGVPFRSSLPQLAESWNREMEREASRDHRLSRHPLPAAGDDQPEWPSRVPLPSSLSRREMGQRLMRDALHYSTSGRRMRIPRESTLRFEMPSPPWSLSDRSRLSPSPGNPTSSHHLDRFSFTPRFAPAYPVDSESSNLSNSTPPLLSRDDGRDSNMPLLRRVGHRSVAHASDHHTNRRHAVDGLGDRERSFSPSDDNDEHDTWETLLTTITPDEHLPSPDSSFTSATASASTALSRNSGLSTSTASSRTLPSSLGSETSRMRIVLDPFPEFITHCDFLSSSEGSDTEAESDVEHETRQQTSQYRREDSGHLNATAEQERPSQSLDGEPSIPSTTTSFGQDIVDADLQQMQAILDRLARREDIPDEWWAAAGLSRTIGRGLTDVQARDTNFPVDERLS